MDILVTAEFLHYPQGDFEADGGPFHARSAALAEWPSACHEASYVLLYGPNCIMVC